jgi:DNA-directed RNA polymerase specialized sigma24 family protein
MYRHFTKHAQHKEDSLDATIDHLSAVESSQPGTGGFEFREWIKFLDPPEQELMILRFVEQWEYHEIAAAHAVPLGTVKWRVFNAKQKLAPLLAAIRSIS